MKTPLSSNKSIYILVVTIFLLAISTSAAFADDGTPPPPQDDTSGHVIIRQGGPVIHREIAIPLGIPLGISSPATVYRAGWTDAWWDWYYPLTQEHHGSHNSQSDLVESQIWADGSLKVAGNNVASCSNHSSGQYAACGTMKVYYYKFQIIATSWHFFHTSGYGDSNFSTQKTANP